MKESKKIYVYLLIYSAIIATAITFCEKYFPNNFFLSVLIPAGVATVVGGGYSLVQKKKEKDGTLNNSNNDKDFIEKKEENKENTKQKDITVEKINCNYNSLDNNISEVVDKPKVFVKKR